jgi:hypothetical protein
VRNEDKNEYENSVSISNMMIWILWPWHNCTYDWVEKINRNINEMISILCVECCYLFRQTCKNIGNIYDNCNCYSNCYVMNRYQCREGKRGDHDSMSCISGKGWWK